MLLLINLYLNVILLDVLPYFAKFQELNILLTLKEFLIFVGQAHYFPGGQVKPSLGKVICPII